MKEEGREYVAKKFVQKWQSERKERQEATHQSRIKDIKKWEHEQQQRNEHFIQEVKLRSDLKKLKMMDT
jgi:hypothetical protein